MGALGIGSCSRTQAVEEEFQKIGIVGKSPSVRPGACSGVGQNKAAGSKSWWVWGRLAAKLEEVHGLEDKGGLTVSFIRALGCYIGDQGRASRNQAQSRNCISGTRHKSHYQI